ncbi:hypothetical protein ACFL2J_04780 [Candidatus Omnitrophota bacterium]
MAIIYSIFNFLYSLEIDYRWFYAALSQSLAALIGIGGMFTVYRLQVQYNRIKESYDNLLRYLALSTKTKITDYYHYTQDDIYNRCKTEKEDRIPSQIKDLREDVKKTNNGVTKTHYEAVINNLENKVKGYKLKMEIVENRCIFLNYLKRRALFIIIFLSILFGVCLVGLLFSKKFPLNIIREIDYLIITLWMLFGGFCYLFIFCANCLDMMIPKKFKYI